MNKNTNTHISKNRIDYTYLQLLVVALSFALMIGITLFIVNDMVRKQLQRESIDRINETRSSIETELSEAKMIVRILADNVERMIEYGYNYNEVTQHISNIASVLNSNAEHLLYDTIHGYFPTLTPTYFNSTGWIPGPDYDPIKRPWYKAGMLGMGEPAFTTLFLSAINGERNIGYSQQLFDSNEQSLGVISINIKIDKIVNHVRTMALTEGGYGVLVTETYEYIYFPSEELIGQFLYDIVPELYDAHSKYGSVYEFEMINYFGVPSIIYSTNLMNGWVLFLVTPSVEYFERLTQLTFLIAIIGAISTIFLCTIIFRLNQNRKKLEKTKNEQDTKILSLEKLREADERVRVSFNRIPIGICYWNRKLELLDCNVQMMSMLGIEDKVELLKRFPDFSPEYQEDGTRSIDSALSNVDSAFVTGRCYFEWNHKHLNGTIIPCKITIIPVSFSNEPLVLACVLDVTEEKQAMKKMQLIQEDLLHAKEIAEESNKIKSKFLAMVSHEIRTPMNVILGVTEANLQSDVLKNEIRMSFETIYDASNILLGIINDILDLSKIESGKFELIQNIFDTASLIRDVTYINLIRYEHKAVAFSLEIDECIPTQLYGDELRIKQILNNVLSNAFKYTEAGIVTLQFRLKQNEFFSDGEDACVTKQNVQHYDEAGACATKQNILANDKTDACETKQKSLLYDDVESCATDQKSIVHDTDKTKYMIWLEITIQDTGIGMSADQLSMLFNEYSRFNLNSNRRKEGTGLGMSITNHLVRMMNGCINVDSSIGSGTTVVIQLPLRRIGSDVLGKEVTQNIEGLQVERKHPKPKPKMIREQMPYGTILVVDDMKTNLDVINMLLKPYNLQIKTALSGFEAIELIKTGQSFDIVFMDHMMPDMDGIETTKILRNMGYDRPIIALSANAVVGQAEVFLSQGFDEFISKPIDTRQLNDILNRLVRDKHR